MDGTGPLTVPVEPSVAFTAARWSAGDKGNRPANGWLAKGNVETLVKEFGKGGGSKIGGLEESSGGDALIRFNSAEIVTE